MTKQPNLFVLGAPKCGTTSLAAWLGQHPNIFISSPKEIDFFDHDRKKDWAERDLTHYMSHFARVQEKHLVLGEASTGYLRSRVAVDEIERHFRECRYIVGLRNPAELAISWHGQLLFAAKEVEPDFETAWRLQWSRREGRNVPLLCPDPADLLYAEVCSLGTQLTRLFEKIPKHRVLVYTLDEMTEDPRKLWLRLMSFLGLPNQAGVHFAVLNEARKVPKVMGLATRFAAHAKRKFGISHIELGIINAINRRIGSQSRSRISDDFRDELYGYFQQEVELMQKATGLDLSRWMCGQDSKIEPPSTVQSDRDVVRS